MRHQVARNPVLRAHHQARLQELSSEAGFSISGFTEAIITDQDKANVQSFALENSQNDLHWFNSHLQLRMHPSDILPGALSVLMLATIYRHPAMDAALENAKARLSRYAAGKDYHQVLRKKAARLADQFFDEFSSDLPDLSYRVTTDSAPVPEKILARMAGLGWQGKNTNLIHPELGSYFFLTGVFFNAELERAEEEGDSLFRPANFDRCGSCRQCIDACPTGALEPYRIQADRCLSYWTIEAKEDMPSEIAENAKSWVFGCDICQEVCPYNRGAKGKRQVTEEASFEPREALMEWMQTGDAESLSRNWDTLATSSPLKRAGLARLQASLRNVYR